MSSNLKKRLPRPIPKQNKLRQVYKEWNEDLGIEQIAEYISFNIKEKYPTEKAYKLAINKSFEKVFGHTLKQLNLKIYQRRDIYNKIKKFKGVKVGGG